jgi:hypothetical protein
MAEEWEALKQEMLFHRKQHIRMTWVKMADFYP